MFCPECRAEYVEGISQCVDCGVPLVAELPPEQAPEPPEYVEFEEVLFTFNAGDVATIKSVLNGEGFAYYFHGEAFNYVHPLAQLNVYSFA